MTFEDHVRAALDGLPAEIAAALHNVAVVVEDENPDDPDLFADAGVTSYEGPCANARFVIETAKAKKLKKKSPLLYLAGEEISRDLAGELREQGFAVTTHIAYRMVPAKSLPGEVVDGFAAGRIEAVLHYSRRSAQAFVEAARSGGVEISALALPQCCMSAEVAEIVREAGATQVTVAARPDENALFEALKRALPARLA